MRYNSFRAINLLVLGILASAGCGTTAKFVYPNKVSNLVRLSDKPTHNLVVAVMPFEEGRSDINQMGTYFFSFVPLMPYGWMTYERPDAARFFNTVREFQFDVSEDLAKAAATSIRRSGLFKDVFFTFGGEKDRADLILTGTVISTKWNGKVITYGLSIAGPYLWLLGLPAGLSTSDFIVKLELKNVKTGDLIWEFAHTDSFRVWQGFYYNWGHDVKGYSSLMERAMNAALKDMQKELARPLNNE
ncbi:MAG: hypothetical protein ABIJ96_18305 [Elusimicrobiota bacterium]